MAKHFTIPAAVQTSVSGTLSVRIYNRDSHTCVYCGAAGVALNVDHIRPQAHYPATTAAAVVNAPRNLVASCTVCNLAKGPQDLAGFVRMLRARGITPALVAAMLRRVRAATRRKLP